MARIEIPIFRDENGKAYTLCNYCGTRFRYKGGSAFCKPECQTHWNKARDIHSRKVREKNNREYEKRQKKIAKERAAMTDEELAEEQRIIDERNERIEKIREQRKQAKKEYEELLERRKTEGHYKPQWRINRYR